MYGLHVNRSPSNIPLSIHYNIFTLYTIYTCIVAYEVRQTDLNMSARDVTFSQLAYVSYRKIWKSDNSHSSDNTSERQYTYFRV